MPAPPGPASRCQAIPACRHALAHRLQCGQGLQYPLPRCGVAAPGRPARFLAIAHSPTAPSRDSARDDATYSGRKSGGPARTGRAISSRQLAGMLDISRREGRTGMTDRGGEHETGTAEAGAGLASQAAEVTAFWSELGLNGLIDVHTHFMPASVM